MPLHLTRATLPSDARPLVDLHYLVTSNSPLQPILLGYDTPSCRAAAASRWTREACRDAADTWFKVVDTATGAIVSAAHWKFYLRAPVEEGKGEEEGEGGDEPALTRAPALEWMEEGSEERVMGEEVLRAFYGQRRERQGGMAHVVLHRLFTHPDYQRRGCGAALVRTGCEIADRLSLPVWVESSPVGERLYRAHGFELVVRPDIKNSRYNMSSPVFKREPRGPIVVGPES